MINYPKTNTLLALFVCFFALVVLVQHIEVCTPGDEATCTSQNLSYCVFAAAEDSCFNATTHTCFPGGVQPRCDYLGLTECVYLGQQSCYDSSTHYCDATGVHEIIVAEESIEIEDSQLIEVSSSSEEPPASSSTIGQESSVHGVVSEEPPASSSTKGAESSPVSTSSALFNANTFLKMTATVVLLSIVLLL